MTIRVGGDRRGDGVDIEVECLEIDAHLDRHEAGLDQERFVGKPGWQAVDDLVAGIGNGLHPDGEGGEPTGGEQDVVRLKGRPVNCPSDAAAASCAAGSYIL